MQQDETYDGDVNAQFAFLAGDCQMGSHANGFFDCPPGLDGVDLVNKASPSSIKLVQRKREVFRFRSIGGVHNGLAVGLERVERC